MSVPVPAQLRGTPFWFLLTGLLLLPSSLLVTDGRRPLIFVGVCFLLTGGMLALRVRRSRT